MRGRNYMAQTRDMLKVSFGRLKLTCETRNYSFRLDARAALA